MKTKNDSVMIFISSIVCLLPLIFSFAVYDKLPEQIAIHWDIAGQANGFAPKAVAAFGLPFMMFGLNLITKLVLYNDPKRSNTSKAVQTIVGWVIPVLSLIVVPGTLVLALSGETYMPHTNVIAPVFTGFIFIVFGNYLPKSRQNYTVGIKLPWTLHDAENWNKTHRLAGYLWIAGGIILIGGAFLPNNITAAYGAQLTVCVIALMVIVPAVYSYLLYKRSLNNPGETDE